MDKVKIYYINLEKRKDRKENIENELKNMGLQGERFDAIENEFACYGCSMSHLGVLKKAKEMNYKHILILEDDFVFLVTKEQMEKTMDTFFSMVYDETVDKFHYDVCMLNYNSGIKDDDTFMYKNIETSNAASYIINGDYLDTLIELFETNFPLLLDTRMHWIYTNDQIWKQLQKKDNWYCLNPRIGKQMADYSDNSKCYVDYG